MAIGHYYEPPDAPEKTLPADPRASDALPLQVVDHRPASGDGRPGLFRWLLLRAWRVPLVIALVATGGLVGL